jgi:putative permease
MKQIFEQWYQRYLTDPEAVILLILLVFSVLIVTTTGYMLAPVFAGIVIAYLLEGGVSWLKRFKCPHWVAANLVYLLFMGAFLFALLVLLPMLMHQLSNFAMELPAFLTKTQKLLMRLPESYPEFLSVEQINALTAHFKGQAVLFGQWVFSLSLSSLTGLITAIIYLVLIPLLVFFFLVDKQKIIDWFCQYLPSNRRLMESIWRDVNYQLGNYVRGKVVEVIIVAVSSYIPFALMNLQYAFLLSVLVGLSVILPFIGVTLVTIPVVIVAFLQWGWTSHFAYLVIIYTIICILDANVLVPLLFSEAVNLHPIAIIVAILFFGGLWGFWGVFFSIPLAILLKTILLAWPRGKVACNNSPHC